MGNNNQYYSPQFSSLINDSKVIDELASIDWKVVSKGVNGLEDCTSEEIQSILFDSKPLSSLNIDPFIAEAVVLEKGRPSLLIQDGKFEKPTIKEWETRLENSRDKLEKVIKSVGRIELFNHDTYDWVGTGWLIESDLIITNRHVAMKFADVVGKKFTIAHNMSGEIINPKIDFKEEHLIDNKDYAEIAIKNIKFIEQLGDTNPDVALIRISNEKDLPEPINISERTFEQDMDICVIGYPAKDNTHENKLLESIFGNIFDKKRLAPGRVSNIPKDMWYFNHDCSTLSGSSGSAVIDIDSGEAIGLHFGGKFRQQNYAVRPDVVKSYLTKGYVEGFEVEESNSVDNTTTNFDENKKSIEIPRKNILIIVSLICLAYFVLAAMTLMTISSEIKQHPQSNSITEIVKLLKNSNRNSHPLTLENAALLQLSVNSLERRHHQSNMMLLSRESLKFGAFLTGMVIIFIGTIFIIAKFHESSTKLEGEYSKLKTTLISSSPGIILSFFGTVLIMTGILTHYEINTIDPNYFVMLGSPSPIDTSEKSLTSQRKNKEKNPIAKENQPWQFEFFTPDGNKWKGQKWKIEGGRAFGWDGKDWQECDGKIIPCPT